MTWDEDNKYLGNGDKYLVDWGKTSHRAKMLKKMCFSGLKRYGKSSWEKALGWWDGSEGKGVAAKLMISLSLIPRIYRVEEEDQLPQDILWLPHMCHNT